MVLFYLVVLDRLFDPLGHLLGSWEHFGVLLGLSGVRSGLCWGKMGTVVRLP